MTTKTITVYKVKKLPKAKTAASVAVEQLDPATVKVTGRVTAAKAYAAAKLRGKAFVVLQKQAGAKWKTVHKVRGNARRALTVIRSLEPGNWRVFLSYAGRKGYKKARSKPVVFQIAAPAAPAV